jgi:hypothetical protein
MSRTLAQFIFECHELFILPTDNKKIIDKPFIVGYRFSIMLSRKFQLYLATQEVSALLPLLKWKARWVSPDGDARLGDIISFRRTDRLKQGSIAQDICSGHCPDNKVCNKDKLVSINVDITSFTGKEQKKASLCLWHKNRDLFDFNIMYNMGNEDEEIIYDIEHGWKKYIKTFLDSTLCKQTLDEHTIKKIYEQNKTSMSCVSCGRPTEERMLFLTTVRYCSCIDTPVYNKSKIVDVDNEVPF